MIKTILFDLNDVLVTYHSKDLDAVYQKEFGMDGKTFWLARKPYMRDYCLGKIDMEKFMLGIMKDLNIAPEKLEMANRLHKDSVTIVAGIKELLEELKENYRIILIAGDGEGSLKFKLDNFGLKSCFDAIYCTCFEGYLKSDPLLYTTILEKEHLKPEECLFIDDREKHTSIASSLGIKVIIFENTEKLRKELKSSGIK